MSFGFLSRLVGEARGQATVELVGLIPLLVSIGFGVFWVFTSFVGSEVAANAAQAGAMALIQDREPEAAVRDALPKGFRKVASVKVSGRRVSVTVPPQRPVPGLTKTLTASSTAYAGGKPDARW